MNGPARVIPPGPKDACGRLIYLNPVPSVQPVEAPVPAEQAVPGAVPAVQ